MVSNVILIDYGMGNLDSVRRAVEECGGRVALSKTPSDLSAATHLILPGVGAFGAGMAGLAVRGLIEPMRTMVFERQVPFLGICLGMQLLATSGEEGGNHAGLGWIPGVVRLLKPAVPAERVPHVGWNEVHENCPSRLFEGIPSGKDFYFVHSYHFVCDDPKDRLAVTPYAGTFTAAVERGNIFGVQFHPEKSQRTGFHLLKNFLALT